MCRNLPPKYACSATQNQCFMHFLSSRMICLHCLGEMPYSQNLNKLTSRVRDSAQSPANVYKIRSSREKKKSSSGIEGISIFVASTSNFHYLGCYNSGSSLVGSRLFLEQCFCSCKFWPRLAISYLLKKKACHFIDIRHISDSKWNFHETTPFWADYMADGINVRI